MLPNPCGNNVEFWNLTTQVESLFSTLFKLCYSLPKVWPLNFFSNKETLTIWNLFKISRLIMNIENSFKIKKQIKFKIGLPMYLALYFVSKILVIFVTRLLLCWSATKKKRWSMASACCDISKERQKWQQKVYFKIFVS